MKPDVLPRLPMHIYIYIYRERERERRHQIVGGLSWDGMTDSCYQSISMIQFTWAGFKVPVAKGCVIVHIGNTLTSLYLTLAECTVNSVFYYK
jgi:hypothetical protein